MSRLDNFFNRGYHKSKRLYVGLFLLVLILANVRQRMITNYGCEICSDKAGYYVYLPAVFQLSFYSKDYPPEFDRKQGYGFDFDTTSGKVITKFTYGVALMLSPFYAAGAFIDKVFSLHQDPFSVYYLFFVNIGAAFYLALGIYYLRKWLTNYVDERSAFWTALIAFFGTNLYYYTLDESLMSHLYSFCLFSILLYCFKSFVEKETYKYYLAFAITLSLAILIRPTNFLFGLIAFFTDVNSWLSFKSRVKLLLKPLNIIAAVLIFAVVIAPQLSYWHFAYGKYVEWTYSAGFIFWKEPRLAEVWFSPQSGLFTYTPIILLSLVFSFVMITRRRSNAVLVIGVFLVTSYMCASWYNPFFGECNFGKRPMIEYYPVLLLPIAYLISWLPGYPSTTRKALLTSMIVLVYYNQALFGAFNTCFNGQPWEWSKFGSLLLRALTVIH
jgi:hypothetical protein